jgi:hypothetical protein
MSEDRRMDRKAEEEAIPVLYGRRRHAARRRLDPADTGQTSGRDH